MKKKYRAESLPLLRRHSKASGAKNILCGVSKMFSCSGSMESQDGGAIE